MRMRESVKNIERDGKECHARLAGKRLRHELPLDARDTNPSSYDIISHMNQKLSQAFWMLLLGCSQAVAVDYVSVERDGETFHLSGRVVTEAADGGLLFEDHEGVFWAIQPDEVVKKASDSKLFKPLDGDALEKRILSQMPDGFRVHRTAHYLICYNTSPVYAQWCGALYERLYGAFQNFWSRRDFELHDPDRLLVALVFDTRASYERYAKAELGDASSSIDGYYSLRTNRVTMYDLTGTGGLRNGARGRFTSTSQINRLLMRPGAERTVATIVHEATHQLAFNCGFHQRYADIPLWVSEGLAVYFETPDLRSSTGWRNIGSVNRVRLNQFRQYLRSRPDESLTSLIADDGRFRQSKTALNAYAEAWALNYFLIRRHSEQYVRYLQQLKQKSPLLFDTPEERKALFTQAFGRNLDSLNEDFLKYLRAVR